MRKLVQEIKQGLEAAFQQQLEMYKTNNTDSKDKLIWDGATLTAKQEAWVRWVDKNGKINCDGVDKTPIELSQLETMLNKKCSELESNINGTFTGRLLKGFADIQHLYLNVIDSDNAVKVVELTMKIRPTVSIEAANIYHFDDETNNKVEENYKNKLKLKNQSNEPTIAVTRLKKSDKSLAENIVDLQAHLLNQTKLKPEEEQEAFNERFQAEVFVEQSSPATPGNSSPVNELEDEHCNKDKEPANITKPIKNEFFVNDTIPFDETPKHDREKGELDSSIFNQPTLESLTYFYYRHKRVMGFTSIASISSAAAFTTLYFTLQTLLPMSMVIACAAFASIVPIVIAAGIYFEMKPSTSNQLSKNDQFNIREFSDLNIEHPLKFKTSIDDKLNLDENETNNDHPLIKTQMKSQYNFESGKKPKSNIVSSSHNTHMQQVNGTVHTVVYLRKTTSVTGADTFTMEEHCELLANTGHEAKLMGINEMKPMTMKDHLATNEKEFSPKENRGLPNPNL